MGLNTIICFGEILWDVFPDKKILGGAPFNVASSLKGLGASVEFISKVGDDSPGKSILKRVTKEGISKDYIQIDYKHNTGEVIVSIDNNGSAKYKIKSNSAWDFIEPNQKALEIVENSSAFIFGSLISRSESKKALEAFLNVSKFNVFDLNLRPPFYQLEILEKLMNSAQMLKFNDEELYEIAEAFGSPFNGMNQHIKFLSQRSKVETICVTKGAFGAVLYHREKWYYNSGYKVKVKDTVGAGDSFLATLVYGLIQKNDIQQTIDEACAMGAIVAASEGANPLVSKQDLVNFLHSK